MAYNRKNKLEQIIEVQNITLEHSRRGVTQQWIYCQLIYPRFRISRSTFYNYLATPAKRDIKAFHNQMSLNF